MRCADAAAVPTTTSAALTIAAGTNRRHRCIVRPATEHGSRGATCRVKGFSTRQRHDHRFGEPGAIELLLRRARGRFRRERTGENLLPAGERSLPHLLTHCRDLPGYFVRPCFGAEGRHHELVALTIARRRLRLCRGWWLRGQRLRGRRRLRPRRF